MSLDFLVKVEPDYVQIDFTGEYTFSDLMKQIDRIRAEAENVDRDHVFIDARLISGQMTESEKFFLGSHIAEVFGVKLKAVAVMPTGHITKLGEMAAVNRGARFFVTESEEEALNWLVSKSFETAS
jgi:hypothetical protein